MRNYFIISTLIIGLSIHAQIQLKGNVKDSNNLAIPYCSIGMKNSEIGAITDENGNFSERIETFKITSDSMQHYINYAKTSLKQESA